MGPKRCNMSALAVLLAIVTVACAARAIDAVRMPADGLRTRHRSLLIDDALDEDKKGIEKWEEKMEHLKKGYDGMWKADSKHKWAKNDYEKETAGKYGDGKETGKYEDSKYDKYDYYDYTKEKDDDYLSHCVKKAHYQCNSFLPLYGPCFMKHWSLCIAEEVYEEKEEKLEEHKYDKHDKYDDYKYEKYDDYKYEKYDDGSKYDKFEDGYKYGKEDKGYKSGKHD